jgi:hypothetical protein
MGELCIVVIPFWLLVSEDGCHRDWGMGSIGYSD